MMALVALIAGLVLITGGLAGSRILADVDDWSSRNTIDDDLTAPRGVYAADIDGDLDMDIVIADVYDIFWYKNDGSQNFGEPITIISGLNSTKSVHVADVDGDGNMDVLGADETLDDIFWCENDGTPADGTWTKREIDYEFNGAMNVYAIDINEDGHMDVVGTAYAAHDVAWFENDGSESFTTRTITSGDFTNAWGVYATDIDGDNDIDIVGVAASDVITWWDNDGSESFTERVLDAGYSGAYGVHAVDIDGDSYVDVVATGPSGIDLTWWANDGSPAAGGWVAADIAVLHNGRYVQAIDIDGDGDIDVLTNDNDDLDVEWWDNDGSESFTERTIDGSFGWSNSLHAADIDQDGWNDVVAVSWTLDDLAWWENENVGQGPVPPIPELPTLVLVGVGLVALAGYLWFRGRRRLVTAS